MYKLTKDNQSIIRKSDGACIPFDPRNIDYQEYLAWGGTPDPYIDPTPQVPYSITQRQMRLTLLEFGIYDQVEAAIEAMEGSDGKAAKITWMWAQEIKRDNPLLLSLASSFGLSEEVIDNLFITAASIE